MEEMNNCINDHEPDLENEHSNTHFIIIALVFFYPFGQNSFASIPFFVLMGYAPFSISTLQKSDLNGLILGDWTNHFSVHFFKYF